MLLLLHHSVYTDNVKKTIRFSLKYILVLFLDYLNFFDKLFYNTLVLKDLFLSTKNLINPLQTNLSVPSVASDTRNYD